MDKTTIEPILDHKKIKKKCVQGSLAQTHTHPHTQANHTHMRIGEINNIFYALLY